MVHKTSPRGLSRPENRLLPTITLLLRLVTIHFGRFLGCSTLQCLFPPRMSSRFHTCALWRASHGAGSRLQRCGPATTTIRFLIIRGLLRCLSWYVLHPLVQALANLEDFAPAHFRHEALCRVRGLYACRALAIFYLWNFRF